MPLIIYWKITYVKNCEQIIFKMIYVTEFFAPNVKYNVDWKWIISYNISSR